MKLRLSLVYASLLLSHIAIAQWRNMAPVGTTINDITFTDRYNGYAVFQSPAIGNCTVSHGLYKTINGGKDWIRMNTGNTSAIYAIHFVNQTTGWITGSSSDIRRTIDGGVTWVQQSSGVGSGNNDIWFKDINNGFVVGNNGILRKTTNGGTSWQTISSGVTTALRRIFFVNNNIGFIACGNGQILRTADGGTNWNVITTGAGGINDIFFADSNTGFLSSGNNLYKTSDSGLSWFPITTSAANPILRIFFTSPQTGYLSVSGEGIYKTTNGGLTWQNTTTLNGVYDSFSALFFIDNNTGFIGGELGRINKTTDGGTTWENVITGLGTALYTVFASHSDTAYAGGNEGKIFKTENGGVSYFQQTKAFSSAINKILFTSNQVGFACSDSGRILKTSDGGKHWVLKPTYTQRGFTDMCFIDAYRGFASASGGLVFKTSNAGETWDSIVTGATETDRAIWFINADTGFVAGGNKIQRTYDGGLTWNTHTSAIASSLQDIVFTNDSLGYCAGSFGKIIWTSDCGLSWFAANNLSGNAGISEMWFANDSLGYFAKNSSQSMTTDSCKSMGSTSTACLANNASMNSISMTQGGMYGYCVGGLNGVIHQTEQREIYRTYTSVNEYCAGSTLFVAYYARGFYDASNIFTAQLSDAFGNFSNAVNIGTYTATPYTYQSGIIYATIPPGTAPGNNYRIRVVASNPATIGVDNAWDISIQSSFLPDVTLNNNAPTSICAGSSVTFTASPFAGGLNPVYNWTINGISVGSNSNILQTSALQDGDTVQVSMLSGLNCLNVFPVFSNTYVATVSNTLPLNLNQDTSVCENSSMQLIAPSGYTYSWFPDTGLSDSQSANPTALITQNITYHLTITDASGCVGTDSVIIFSNPPPSINFTADTALCENSCITLTPIIGGNIQNILWSPVMGLNDSTVFNPLACPTVNTSYTATVTDFNQCTNSSSITVSVNPLPAIPLLTFDGTTLTSTIAESYQWYVNNSLIQGANSITYLPINNGDYTVMVTNAFGCTAESDPFTININSLVKNTKASDFWLATNLIFNTLQIVFLTPQQVQQVYIYNAQGQKVYEQNAPFNEKINIDATKLSTGVYFVWVQTLYGVSQQKICVLK